MERFAYAHTAENDLPTGCGQIHILCDIRALPYYLRGVKISVKIGIQSVKADFAGDLASQLGRETNDMLSAVIYISSLGQPFIIDHLLIFYGLAKR